MAFRSRFSKIASVNEATNYSISLCVKVNIADNVNGIAFTTVYLIILEMIPALLYWIGETRSIKASIAQDNISSYMVHI